MLFNTYLIYKLAVKERQKMKINVNTDTDIWNESFNFPN